MTAPPVGDKREDDGAGEEDGAAVVCVSSESFLEKRGKDGEDRKHLPVFFAWNAVAKIWPHRWFAVESPAGDVFTNPTFSRRMGVSRAW